MNSSNDTDDQFPLGVNQRTYKGRIEPSGEEVTTVGPTNFWEPSVDFPHYYSVSGWQRSDDEHPVEEGTPGYRIAYKTIKVFPYPGFMFTGANFRLTIDQGKVNRGGIRLPNTIPGRLWNHHLIPEYGRLVSKPEGIHYEGSPDLVYNFPAYDEEVDNVSFVEIIVRLDGLGIDNSDRLFSEGRMKVASLRMMLDLLFGPRLIGSCLLEEIGCVFDDWHWNRLIGSAHLAAESQVDVDVIPAEVIKSQITVSFDRYLNLDEAEIRRIRFASRWFWLAEDEPDQVNRFIQYWIAIEALEMKTNSSDPTPAKKRFARIMGRTDGVAHNFIGRLWKLRGELVHGDAMEVSATNLERVELAAKILLSWRILKAVPLKEYRRVTALMTEK